MNRFLSLAAACITVFLLFFLISCTLSPSWSVQRRIFVNAKPEAVMHYAENQANWLKWNVWAQRNAIKGVAIESQKPGEIYYTVILKDKETRECLVMVTASDFGSYVFLRVDGKTPGSPLSRYLISARTNRLGAGMQAGLRELKKLAEKK